MRASEYERLLSHEAQDEAFKREYKALETEFSLVREFIVLRKEYYLTAKELAEQSAMSKPAIVLLESE